MGFDQLAHKRAHPRDELRLAASAVGKEGIVGDVEVARIGPRLDDLAKNGEAAEPGIKDEDARCHEDLWLELLRHMARVSGRRGALPLPMRTRACPSSAIRVVEVGQTRLRLGEGWGEGVSGGTDRSEPLTNSFLLQR